MSAECGELEHAAIRAQVGEALALVSAIWPSAWR
jgi:hypothetical protein